MREPTSINTVHAIVRRAIQKDNQPSVWSHFHDIELDRKNLEISSLESQLEIEKRTVNNLRKWLKLSMANKQALILGNVVGWALVMMLLMERLWK